MVVDHCFSTAEFSTDHTQIKKERYNTCFAYVINLFCWVYPTISKVDTQEVYTYAILSNVILWILWHVLDTKLSYLVVKCHIKANVKMTFK